MGSDKEVNFMRPVNRKTFLKKEALKAEIQNEIAKNRGTEYKPSKIMQFLNNSFVIWFLSSVALAIFTWVYSCYQADENIKKQNASTIKKIDVEIKSRVSHVRRLSDPLRYSSDANIPADLLDRLIMPPGESRTIIPEFANRNLKSMLYELSVTLPEIESRYVEELISSVESVESTYYDKLKSQEQLKLFYKEMEVLERKVRAKRPKTYIDVILSD